MIDKIVLDTHILLWSLVAPDNLSSLIKEEINLARENDSLYICDISLWEIAMLAHKKRINVYEPIRDFLESIVRIKGLNTLPITPISAAESVALLDDNLSDPADRIIIATTREFSAILVTRDKRIIDYSTQGHLRIIVG